MIDEVQTKISEIEIIEYRGQFIEFERYWHYLFFGVILASIEAEIENAVWRPSNQF